MQTPRVKTNCRPGSGVVNGLTIPENLPRVVAGVLARLPEWVRADLGSKDPAARTRAEETLTAMIVAAASAVPSGEL